MGSSIVTKDAPSAESAGARRHTTSGVTAPHECRWTTRGSCAMASTRSTTTSDVGESSALQSSASAFKANVLEAKIGDALEKFPVAVSAEKP